MRSGSAKHSPPWHKWMNVLIAPLRSQIRNRPALAALQAMKLRRADQITR
jgi:hypothetical protein